MSCFRFHADDRVAEDGKIGPAACALDRVVRVGFARIKMRRGRRGQMSACREAPDADALGVDVPLRRAGTYHAESALHILHRRRMMIARRQPVLKDKRRYSMVIEPAGNIAPLVSHGEINVAAARTNHNRRAVGGVRRRQIARERGLVFVRVAERPWGAMRPEHFDLRICP